MAAVAQPSKLREKFFEYLFDDQTGYLCIATANKTQDPKDMRKSFQQTFFRWPNDKDAALDYVTNQVPTCHLWYSVNLFAKPERKKEYANAGRIIYADLDACNPGIVEPHPSLVTETSPGRYQGIWRTDGIIGPDLTEDYSRRIAYRYSINGADKSGWDTGQLLRIPYTRNYKYPGNPEIRIIELTDDLLPLSVFEALETPQFSQNGDGEDGDMPELDKLPDPEAILYKFEAYFKSHQKSLTNYYAEPDADADWSSLMWNLINTCFEAGMDETEVFSIAFHAKCNKYERDQRPIRYLWKEVLKAAGVQKSLSLTFYEQGGYLTFPDIANEPATESFADTYVNWATDTTDAVPVYHELAAFIVLSTLLASNIRLEVRYGTLVPNLWGLILGESTLARKTTAMQLATEMILSLDEQAIVATDGSMEGLFDGIAERPGRSSMFLRDEISGFFDSINRKDYLAGMSEAFTSLYDSPALFRRRLRKSTIVIERPIVIFFGAGIRDRVYSAITDEYILSGFLPRFLIVSGDSKVEDLQWTKPRMQEDMQKRKAVKDELAQAFDRYNTLRPASIAGQTFMKAPEFQAELTEEAWELFGNMEMTIAKTAAESHVSQYALPVFERLSKSLLKMAVLLAAMRRIPENDAFSVTVTDVKNAAYYVQKWAKYSIEMIYSAGKTPETRMLEKMIRFIDHTPGVFRSNVMQRFHLNKKAMDLFEATLIERGEMRIQKSGKGYRYWVT